MKNLYTLFILSLIIFPGVYAQSPNWLWAKSAGGANGDAGYGISTDASGNILVTGYFEGYSITFGTTTITGAGYSDVFVVKHDASGNVQWAKSAGGTGDDMGLSISTDASGNVLVTGYFASPSITFGTTTLTNANTNGTADIFVVKYDASGNVLWAKSAGGTGDDMGLSISTDASGNVLATGRFAGSSITFGTTTLSNAGSTDIFVVKYDAGGNVLWAKSAGGASYDYGYGISTDFSGNVLVTGSFWGTSITFGSTTLTNAGSGTNDIFVVKYDTSGNVLWAKGAGGTDSDVGYGITTDATGNVLATGYFMSPSITFGTTALSLSSAGSSDIFIVKYDASGNVLWAKSTGGTDQDFGQSLTINASGNVLLAGYFRSSSITFGSTTLTNAGSATDDIFIVKYDANGNVLWAKSAGGTDGDVGYGISTDAIGNILVTGRFDSPSINFGTTTLTNAGFWDIFIANLSESVGVEEAGSEDSQIKIYPNPSTGKFTIHSQEKISSIEIFNVLGERIYYTHSNLSSLIKLDISDQPLGVYILQLKTEKGTATEKVVVSD